jgi:diaminopimelate decarboxylase
VRRSLDAAASRLAGSPTPARLLLPDVLRVRLAALRRLCTEVEAGVGVRVEVAYSVKTNPATELIGAVRQAGLLAEVISQQEVRRCLDIGFPPERLVLTGPGKWWPETGRCSVGAILCDSLHDLGHTMGLLERGRVQTGVLGVRLAPLHHRSRFGVPADEPKAFHDLRALLGGGRWDGPLGLHFHLASSRVGGKAWLREVDAVLQLAARISHDAATRVHTVDLGGGWPAAALDDGRLRWFLGAAAERVRLALPGTRRILVEPGKLIAEPSMALLATVLDIRSRHGRRAAVLDASVAELPDGTHVHPVLWKAQSRGWWRRLGPGPDELYGRLCMENDTIGHDVQLPAALAVGDTMAFLDAGAYDASMSYRFGQ